MCGWVVLMGTGGGWRDGRHARFDSTALNGQPNGHLPLTLPPSTRCVWAWASCLTPTPAPPSLHTVRVGLGLLFDPPHPSLHTVRVGLRLLFENQAASCLSTKRPSFLRSKRPHQEALAPRSMRPHHEAPVSSVEETSSSSR